MAAKNIIDDFQEPNLPPIAFKPASLAIITGTPSNKAAATIVMIHIFLPGSIQHQERILIEMYLVSVSTGL